jgi:hypothetical protein
MKNAEKVIQWLKTSNLQKQFLLDHGYDYVFETSIVDENERVIAVRTDDELQANIDLAITEYFHDFNYIEDLPQRVYGDLWHDGLPKIKFGKH